MPYPLGKVAFLHLLEYIQQWESFCSSMSAYGIQGLGVLVFSPHTHNPEKQDAFHKMRQCLNAFFEAGPIMQSTRNSHFNIPWFFKPHHKGPSTKWYLGSFNTYYIICKKC